MEYVYAWILYYVALGLMFWGLMRLMRNWSSGLRQFLIALLVVILCVPATSANLPGHLAPAFVVLIFETAFQQQGDPGPAVLALVGSAVVMVAFLLVRHVLKSRAAHR